MLRIVIFVIILIEWTRSKVKAGNLYEVCNNIELSCFKSSIWTISQRDPSGPKLHQVNPNGKWFYDVTSQYHGRSVYRREDYKIVYETGITKSGWYAMSNIGRAFLHCGAAHIQACFAGAWRYTTRHPGDEDTVAWAKGPDPMGTVVLNFWRMMVNDSAETECDNLYLYGDELCISGAKWTLYDDQCINNMPMFFSNDKQGNGYNIYYEQSLNEWILIKNKNETIAFCKEPSLINCDDDSWFVYDKDMDDELVVAVKHNLTTIDNDGCNEMMDDNKEVLSAGGIIGISVGIMILFILLICIYYRSKSNIAKNELKRLVEDIAVV